MKTKHILIALALLLISTSPILAQKSHKIEPAQIQFLRLEQKTPIEGENISPKATTVLSGKWIRNWESHREDWIVYKRPAADRHQWGDYLEFGKEMQVIKGYSAPCGNDKNIHRHEGKYHIKEQTLFLNLGENGQRKYKVVEMSETALVLEEIKQE